MLSLKVRDHFFHPYEPGSIIILCILIFIVLESERDDKRFGTLKIRNVFTIYSSPNISTLKEFTTAMLLTLRTFSY